LFPPESPLAELWDFLCKSQVAAGCQLARFFREGGGE
jgi:hypothetical protein